MSDTNPDTVFVNTSVITMDAHGSRAEAVAVTDGRISAVGSRDDILATATDRTEVIDLGGQVLMPGFVEAHGHVLLMAQLLAPPTVDVRPMIIPEWPDVLAAIQADQQSHPAGTPLVAFGFDPIGHGRPAPDIRELDELFPDNPLILLNFTAHSANVNTKAFELAGITKETPNPAGGHFGHYDDGELNGEVFEATAMVQLVVPYLGALKSDVGKMARSQYSAMARAGVTTVGELLTQGNDVQALTMMAAAPGNPLRIRSYEGTNDSKQTAASRGNGNDMFRQVGLKLWVDGAPWLGNVSLKQPYLNTQATRNMGLPADHCGSANYSEAQLLDIMRAYVPSGFQMACHVHGDKGVDTILDVYETILTENDLLGTDHRWRLEHCGAMTAEQYRRAAELGLTCSLFIHHLYFWGDVLVDDLFGEERGAHWMRCRSALDSGMRISLHNDGYVTPPDPIGNAWSAVNRISRKSGKVYGPEERITVDEALRAVTIDAAWQLFSDDHVGSIELGKYADFVVLDADPYAVDPATLNETVHVVDTYLAGVKTNPNAFAG